MHRMANIQVQFTWIEFLSGASRQKAATNDWSLTKPLRTARISPDGNCFFRCFAKIVTGSQEYHKEMRLIVTTYMIYNSSNEKLSCLLPRNTSMQSYIVQSKMQFPGEWATDLEITAASYLLNTKIHVLNFTGKIYVSGHFIFLLK